LIFKKGPAKYFTFENSPCPWRDYFQKQNILQGPKTTKKKLQELKPKRGIFAGIKTIF